MNMGWICCKFTTGNTSNCWIVLQREQWEVLRKAWLRRRSWCRRTRRMCTRPGSGWSRRGSRGRRWRRSPDGRPRCTQRQSPQHRRCCSPEMNRFIYICLVHQHSIISDKELIGCSLKSRFFMIMQLFLCFCWYGKGLYFQENTWMFSVPPGPWYVFAQRKVSEFQRMGSSLSGGHSAKTAGTRATARRARDRRVILAGWNIDEIRANAHFDQLIVTWKICKLVVTLDFRAGQQTTTAKNSDLWVNFKGRSQSLTVRHSLIRTTHRSSINSEIKPIMCRRLSNVVYDW